MKQAIKRIAMWSGPRNLSTAMMYSFASRSDTAVIDEPFYAAYLKTTGIIHPMNDEVLAAGEQDPEKIARFCTRENPGKQAIFYQKHMTKHMIESFHRDWIFDVCNVFLIRDPAQVIASYHSRVQDPELSDIGVKEQLELFNSLCQKNGSAPAVIDSADILKSPESMLKSLCKAIEIDFQPAMLSWQTGPKSYDGVWAAHWYKSVWKSTGFAAPVKANKSKVPDHLLGLLESANGYFKQINKYKLRA